MFAGTLGSGVYKRSIAELIASNDVEPLQQDKESIIAYPNPFSQSTTIAFTSPESGIAEVSIVNILGTEVAHLFSGELTAGEHQFQWDGSGMADGMYECIVRMNGGTEQSTILLSR